MCIRDSLGTERHEARRIDNQLRGRSGRQGDPGETQFFLSLEAVSYTHLRAHETVLDLVCRLLLEKKKQIITR